MRAATEFYFFEGLLRLDWVLFSDALKHILLAGLYSSARLTRLVRSSMLDVLSEDYVRTARAKGLSEWVAVMYLGQLVEMADADEIAVAPCHPYTEALVSAVPVPDPHAQRSRIILKGDVPSPVDPPAGCRFHPRCPHAKALCATKPPPLREIRPGHFAACHFSEQIYGGA